MAADNSPPRSPTSTCYFQKTVTLLDWWLTKPQTHHHTNTLGVAGLTSQQNRAARCFSSAPILKVFDLFELETVDGVSVILQGYINKDRTLENGFPSEVFDHFIIGFPSNWKEYCPKIESAVKFVTTVQEEDGKDCIEGLDIHGKQNCDSNTVDMGVEDCKETVLSNKDTTPLNASLDEIPHEHIIEAGNEVLCERSPVTQAFPSVETSPIVINTVVSSTRPKCLGVSNRRVTRSMKKMGISKNSCPLVNDKGALTDPGILGSSVNLNNEAVNAAVHYDMKSKSRNIDSELSDGCGKGSNDTASCSKDTVIKVESKRKQIDQTVDVVIVKDTRNKDDADVSDESQIDTRITDLKEKHFTPKASDPLSKMSVGVTDVNDDSVLARTNMKSCRNQRKNRVDVPQIEGAPATHGISSKEAVITRNRSRTKLELPVKRKLITSPKSAKSTPLRGKKRSESRNGSANILSIESFSGKKSRSGRVVLPRLEFWRNQKVVYDEAGEMCGVEEPK